MKKRSPAEKKQYLVSALIITAALMLIGILSALCMPFFSRLSDPTFREELQIWIHSLGFQGWLILLGIQMLQIVIAFIPGEPVELLAGVLYGAWGGLATCLLGTLLASTAIFFTVRMFGYPLVVGIFGKEKLNQFKFLNNAEKVAAVTFILFLIPGTPKDMLTYLAGVSRIKPAQFLLISTFARIPSVITSTLMGATMSRGNWGMTVLLFLLTAAIGLIGIFYKEKFMQRIHKEHGGH
ncbi:VTT domain-containing protein [Oscillospiraceae bacterium PP1C4]